MKLWEKTFDQGYYCACAIMLRLYDQPTMIESCLRENRMTVAKALEGGIPQDELEILLPILLKLEKEMLADVDYTDTKSRSDSMLDRFY